MHTIVNRILDGGERCDNTLYVCEGQPAGNAEGGLTAGLVTLPSCMGTLKSTRMRTRLPLRSRSVMESLLERDMVGDGG